MKKWGPIEEVLILAMKKEKAAHDLYTDLAAGIVDETIKAAFLKLAQGGVVGPQALFRSRI